MWFPRWKSVSEVEQLPPERMSTGSRFKRRFSPSSKTADDPGTFNQPWSGSVRWQRVNRQMLESICAENNEAFEKYFVNLKEYPMPQAKTPDF
jgi:hypothetical protein